MVITPEYSPNGVFTPDEMASGNTCSCVSIGPVWTTSDEMSPVTLYLISAGSIDVIR